MLYHRDDHNCSGFFQFLSSLLLLVLKLSFLSVVASVVASVTAVVASDVDVGVVASVIVFVCSLCCC